MSVLVTGASGFSGAIVSQTLARAGFEVVALSRRPLKFAEPGVKSLQGDLADIADLAGPFASVVHIAATSPMDGITDVDIVRDNVAGTLALLDATRRWRSERFVFFSSISLYGDVAGGVLDETSPIVNPDAYGASKYLCELLLKARANDLPSVSLRLPGVLGPGAHRNWLSGVAAKLLAGDPVRAYHLDSLFNNAAHIGDIAALVAGLLGRSWMDADSVVLGARGTLPVRAVIERLANGLGVDAKIEVGRPQKPPFTLSSERALARWGYEPMEIGALIDRYAADVLSARTASAGGRRT